MTIQESNKLIAEFMGFLPATLEEQIAWLSTSERGLKKMRENNPEYIPTHFNNDKSQVLFDDTMQYHISWDWLMPVVEKICAMDNAMAREVTRTFGAPLNIGNIEIIYESVVEFIKWWNDEKQTNDKRAMHSL